MSELIDLSATEIATGVASGAIDPVDVVEVMLARIAAREGAVEAWAHVDADAARAEARKLSEEAKAGTLRGPLHGVPIGIKDVFHAEGMPTLANSKTMNSQARYPDSGTVAALRKAGAIILGKTTTVEFAGMGVPPASRNPWNQAHTGGGSSSGSGVAVGAKMVPAAIGTQTGGSNIRPAAYNGVAGLKPSYGALPRSGLLPVAWSLDHPGLITKSARDLELIFTAVAKTKPAPFEAPKRWRIGVPREFFFETSAPDTVAKVDAALAKLTDVDFVDVKLPELFKAHRAIHHLIMSTEMAVFHAPRIAEHYETMTERHRITSEAFSLVPAGYYLQALRAKRMLVEAMTALFADIDVLAMPTTPGPAPEGLESTGDASLQVAWSLTGFPEATVPVGLSDTGLPLGLQFVAPLGKDLTVIKAAIMAEEVLGRLELPA
jgi:aspartyl-tRNA(Asn)/glutamyl-tRNA(Gln) amidotransferase subunit A